MRGFHKQEFCAGINRILDDTHQLEITKFALEVYGHGDWTAINDSLAEWEKQGLLKILRNPEQASKDDVCVRMASYINRPSPWPDWP
jgi:hypothetical protein